MEASAQAHGWPQPTAPAMRADSPEESRGAGGGLLEGYTLVVMCRAAAKLGT